MLTEIDLTNTLSSNAHTFTPPISTAITSVERLLGPSTRPVVTSEQPNRPFSHPSHLFNRDLNSNCVNMNDIYSTALFPNRPSSTPVSVSTTNLNPSFLAHTFRQSPSKLGTSSLSGVHEVSCDAEKIDYPNQDTPRASDQPVLSKSDSPSFMEAQDFDLTFNSGKFVQPDTDIVSGSTTLVPSEHCFQNWDHHQVRIGSKRPHSVTPNRTTWFDSDDSLMRPLSAPKRLLMEAHVSSSLSSFLTTETNTPVPAVMCTNNNTDAPKSTLEALVASTSPLMFFPHEFSMHINTEDKLAGDFNTKLSATAAIDQVVPRNSYSIDLLHSTDENPNKSDSDLNINANSVSSSKSLTSLDLSDPNAKGPDSSQSSNKSGFSDYAINSDGNSEHESSVTMRINEYVQAMKTYVAELCPVDCVIFLEHCRPFNCDTIFMKYFRDQYLSPILSNLNGGPPLNADFGRDAYTSLYSLHGYCWHKPSQTTPLVPDTPVIYRILKRVATMQHESRHISDQMNESCSGYELLQAAVHGFDTIDRARRGLCPKVQRHLILLAVSPINLVNTRLTSESDSENCADRNNPLTNLIQRGVALSVFSPVCSPSLLELYELVNGYAIPVFHDRHWQTVALSKKLSQCDLPERRIIGPIAATFHAQTEAEIQALEQQQVLSKQLANDNSTCPEAQLPDSNNHYNPQAPIMNKHQYHAPDHSSAAYYSNNSGNCDNTVANTTANNDNSNNNSTIANDNVFFTSVATSINGGIGSTGNPIIVSTNTYSNGTNSPMTTMMSTDALYRSAQNRNSTPIQQFNPNISPNGSYQRVVRGNASSNIVHQQAPVAASQLPPPAPAYAVRGVTNGRVMESARSVESLSHSANALSAGHSGPNSVDQTPANLYGSDSVTTPQGMYSSQTSTVSPQQQQVGHNSHPPPQLHSPISSVAHQATPPSYGLYHSNTNQVYHQYQQSVYDVPGTIKQSVPGSSAPPTSSSPMQIPFRPPSNTPSPSSQYAVNVQTIGLSSPCSTRNSSKQYSPHQQGSPQHRLACPPGNPKAQFVRVPQVSNTGQLPDNLTGHPRSDTPNNPVFPMNSVVSSSPSSLQFSNYLNKDILPTSSVQCKNLSPSASVSTHTGLDGHIVPHQSNMSAASGLANNMPPTSSMMRRPQMPLNVQQLQAQQQAAASPASQLPTRSVFWEGEMHMFDPNGVGVTRLPTRLYLEQCGVRDLSQLNMHLWSNTAQLSIVQVYRDSPLVERLSSSFASGQLSARLLVELSQPNEMATLINTLSAQANMMVITLGVLSPLTVRLQNPIQPGTIGFICLIYNPKRNRIHGLIPYDSEQFRQDLFTSHFSNRNMSNSNNNNNNSNSNTTAATANNSNHNNDHHHPSSTAHYHNQLTVQSLTSHVPSIPDTRIANNSANLLPNDGYCNSSSTSATTITNNTTATTSTTVNATTITTATTNTNGTMTNCVNNNNNARPSINHMESAGLRNPSQSTYPYENPQSVQHAYLPQYVGPQVHHPTMKAQTAYSSNPPALPHHHHPQSQSSVVQRHTPSPHHLHDGSAASLSSSQSIPADIPPQTAQWMSNRPDQLGHPSGQQSAGSNMLQHSVQHHHHQQQQHMMQHHLNQQRSGGLNMHSNNNNNNSNNNNNNNSNAPSITTYHLAAHSRSTMDRAPILNSGGMPCPTPIPDVPSSSGLEQAMHNNSPQACDLMPHSGSQPQSHFAPATGRFQSSYVRVNATQALNTNLNYMHPQSFSQRDQFVCQSNRAQASSGYNPPNSTNYQAHCNQPTGGTLPTSLSGHNRFMSGVNNNSGFAQMSNPHPSKPPDTPLHSGVVHPTPQTGLHPRPNLLMPSCTLPMENHTQQYGIVGNTAGGPHPDLSSQHMMLHGNTVLPNLGRLTPQQQQQQQQQHYEHCVGGPTSGIGSSFFL